MYVWMTTSTSILSVFSILSIALGIKDIIISYDDADAINQLSAPLPASPISDHQYHLAPTTEEAIPIAAKHSKISTIDTTMHTRMTMRTIPAAKPMLAKTAVASEVQAALMRAEPSDANDENDGNAGLTDANVAKKIGSGSVHCDDAGLTGAHVSEKIVGSGSLQRAYDVRPLSSSQRGPTNMAVSDLMRMNGISRKMVLGSVKFVENQYGILSSCWNASST